jgi:hypothetical protein
LETSLEYVAELLRDPKGLLALVNGDTGERLMLELVEDDALDRLIDGVSALSGSARDRALTYLMIQRDARS